MARKRLLFFHHRHSLLMQVSLGQKFKFRMSRVTRREILVGLFLITFFLTQDFALLANAELLPISAQPSLSVAQTSPTQKLLVEQGKAL